MFSRRRGRKILEAGVIPSELEGLNSLEELLLSDNPQLQGTQWREYQQSAVKLHVVHVTSVAESLR